MKLEPFKQDTICAGIVLYNPDLRRLRKNVEAIGKQVDIIIFADNGSTNQTEVDKYISTLEIDYIIIQNSENKGIAVALNQIMEVATNRRIDWVLTLDQDSVCPTNLISIYRKYMRLPNVGILCPLIKDRNFGYLVSPNKTNIQKVDECITSASLTLTKVWKNVGGFDEQLFIDGVDTEYCYRLRNFGYDILRINEVTLIHEIGRTASIVNIFGHRFIVYNHAPFRYFYITRNLIYIAKKHNNYKRPQIIKIPAIIFIRLYLTLIYEKEKTEKIKAILRGVAAGIKMRNKI